MKITDRITKFYLYFIIGIYPLIFSVDGYKNIFETKAFVFFSISTVYIFLIVLSCIIRRYVPKINAVHYAGLLYALLTLVSAILSDNFPKTLLGATRLEGAVTICVYCAIFICVSLFGRISNGMIYTLIGSSSVLGIVSVLQLQGFNPFGLYPMGYNFFDSGVRYSGSYISTIGNADLTGAYLSIVIPLLAFILLKSRLRLRFIALLPLTLLLYTALKMSVSALIVGLASALVVAVPVVLSFKRRSIYIYFFAVISAFILLLIFIKNYCIGNGFFYELHEILNGRISDEFGSNRIRIWREVISVIPERALLGKGADTMIYENFEPFSTYYPALSKTLTTSIDVAHNEYLNVLYHQGLLGLCSYLAILFLTFAKFTKKPSALGVAAVAYSVQAFFGFSMCLTAPFFWVLLALINSKADASAFSAN